MLKIAFEVNSVGELKDEMSTFLSALNGGASVAEAAGVKGSKKSEAAQTKKAPTLEDVQKALTSVKGKKAEKIKILGKYMAEDLDGLDESDYESFINDMAELANA